MKMGVDTNVLVYAHIASFDVHDRVRDHLETLLARETTILCVTPRVMLEFLHITTDPRRFDPPLDMQQAIAITRGWTGRTNIEILAEDETCCLLALDLVSRHSLGRRRLADALIAATLIVHGVTDLLTCNPDDFLVFENLSPRDPSLPHPWM